MDVCSLPSTKRVIAAFGGSNLKLDLLSTFHEDRNSGVAIWRASLKGRSVNTTVDPLTLISLSRMPSNSDAAEVCIASHCLDGADAGSAGVSAATVNPSEASASATREIFRLMAQPPKETVPPDPNKSSW